jgi:hypothetical protein
MEQMSEKQFDPTEFDPLAYYPKRMHDQPQAHTLTELVRETAETDPQIPRYIYDLFFTMDGTICSATNTIHTHDPRIFIPLLYKTYLDLQAEGKNTGLATLQLTTVLNLRDEIAQHPESANVTNGQLNFFAEYAKSVKELRKPRIVRWLGRLTRSGKQ